MWKPLLTLSSPSPPHLLLTFLSPSSYLSPFSSSPSSHLPLIYSLVPSHLNLTSPHFSSPLSFTFIYQLLSSTVTYSSSSSSSSSSSFHTNNNNNNNNNSNNRSSQGSRFKLNKNYWKLWNKKKYNFSATVLLELGLYSFTCVCCMN